MTHIPEEKIKFIESIITDPVVGPLYEAWRNIPIHNNQYPTQKILQAREKAFREYCEARDVFIGLKPRPLEINNR